MTSIIDLLVTTGKWQMMHILLDDDREWSFLLQLSDLDLAFGRINLFNNAAHCSKTSAHDFLRIETKRIVSAVAQRS